jgi:hypothetical protein
MSSFWSSGPSVVSLTLTLSGISPYFCRFRASYTGSGGGGGRQVSKSKASSAGSMDTHLGCVLHDDVGLCVLVFSQAQQNNVPLRDPDLNPGIEDGP